MFQRNYLETKNKIHDILIRLNSLETNIKNQTKEIDDQFDSINVKNSINFDNGASLESNKNGELLVVDSDNHKHKISYLSENVHEFVGSLKSQKSLLSKFFEALEGKYIQTNLITELKQDDFKTGSYIIKTPGLYRLGENISFNPNSNAFLNSNDPEAILLRTKNSLSLPLNPYQTSDVLPSQYSKYEPQAYGLGFFTAIAIQCDNVILDLNNYTLDQSDEHALQQKFFSLIELADQAFIPKQGPHFFGSLLVPARFCHIKNGTLGNNSHHGIHGNDNKNIFLQNIIFESYEVAACSLNKVDGLFAENVHAEKNRHTVPILAIWSAAKFLRPYINHLVSQKWTGSVAGKSVAEIAQDLKNAVNKTFRQVLVDKNWGDSTPEFEIFGNTNKIIDGNSYGFLINSGGAAVLGFPQSRATPSKNVYFENVTVSNSEASIVEVPALKHADAGGIMNDSVGAVFQTQNKGSLNNQYLTIDQNRKYIGNVVSNTQLIVSKAIHEGFDFGPLSTSRNSIHPNIVKWADNKINWSELNVTFVCNGDGMFHVNKGVVIFKMDGSENIVLENCHCTNISNSSSLGSKLANDSFDYKHRIGISHPRTSLNGFGGCNLRGFSFSTSKNVFVYDCSCRNLISKRGQVYGFDLHGYSKKIILENSEVVGLKAGGENKKDLDLYLENPTPLPLAIGVHVGKNVTDYNILDFDVFELNSIYKKYICLTEALNVQGASR